MGTLVTSHALKSPTLRSSRDHHIRAASAFTIFASSSLDPARMASSQPMNAHPSSAAFSHHLNGELRLPSIRSLDFPFPLSSQDASQPHGHPETVSPQARVDPAWPRSTQSSVPIVPVARPTPVQYPGVAPRQPHQQLQYMSGQNPDPPMYPHASQKRPHNIAGAAADAVPPMPPSKAPSPLSESAYPPNGHVSRNLPMHQSRGQGSPYANDPQDSCYRQQQPQQHPHTGYMSTTQISPQQSSPTSYEPRAKVYQPYTSSPSEQGIYPMQQQQQQQPLGHSTGYPTDSWQNHPYNTQLSPLIPLSAELPRDHPMWVAAEQAAATGDHIPHIIEHCNVLSKFAAHYAKLSQERSAPVAPEPRVKEEMASRALVVVNILTALRRLPTHSRAQQLNGQNIGESVLQDGRIPKRPWEESSASSGSRQMDGSDRGDDGNMSNDEAPHFQNSMLTSMFGTDKEAQALAQKDMDTIKHKRSAAGANAGALKSKYKKRSRATPPGRCHSCNIRETPEWRRGPDGARTLCNACGLHYAKLIRRRDRCEGDGQSALPPIDIEMLRDSSRLAAMKDAPLVPSPPHQQQLQQRPAYPPGPSWPDFNNQNPYNNSSIRTSHPASSTRTSPHL
ncbi:hypothetical protein BOTBODRAFT_149615 [Botryobasidium botryosum FD-172 SS1]|uniref:GATA-type domain-containing protein n=1 Tax=Botryobasidium botryosum (strain FD-172 SS1) TaxID=930990 RepID=A0A067LTE4_BOTB1|nr:hypothetical protein BOTBODRAFT_149615 [Botryobasidium botryosum FD-172 SS1]